MPFAMLGGLIARACARASSSQRSTIFLSAYWRRRSAFSETRVAISARSLALAALHFLRNPLSSCRKLCELLFAVSFNGAIGAMGGNAGSRVVQKLLSPLQLLDAKRPVFIL